MKPYDTDEISKANMLNLIQFGILFTDNRNKTQYPQELPPELEQWYDYFPDAGHCIMCLPGKVQSNSSTKSLFFSLAESNSELLSFDIDHLMLQSDAEIRNWLVPASVKAIKRGYRMIRGYVVSNLEYNLDFGLIQEDGDEEY